MNGRANFGRMNRTDVSSGQDSYARALEGLGRAVGALGAAVENNYRENQRLAGENYERARSFWLRTNYAPGLEKAASPEDVDALRKNADEHLQKMGEQMLGGEKNFKRYLQHTRRGELFTQELNALDAAGKKRVTEAQTEALNAQKIALAAKEYAALPDDPETQAEFKENLRREFAGPDGALGVEKTAAFMEAFEKRALAELNDRDYLRALNRAVSDPDAAKKEFLDAKLFIHLTPQQREHFFAHAQRIAAAREGTGKDREIYPVVDAFAGVAEASPALAAQLLKDLRENPASRPVSPELDKLMGQNNALAFKNALGALRADKFKTALNAMEELAKSPDMQTGRDAVAALSMAEQEFNLLKPVTDKKGKQKPITDENGRELSGGQLTRRLITARETVNGFLEKGTLVLDENKKKALAMSREYAKRIGSELAKKPQAVYRSKRNLSGAGTVLFAAPLYGLELALRPGETADQTAVDLINDMADKINMPPEDRGGIYYDFIRNAAARNLNLASAEEAEKKRVRELFEQVRMRYLQNRAGVPSGAYGAVILDGRAAAYAPNADPNLGAVAKGYDGYKYETIDGVEQLVRRNAAGEIVDIINAEHA